MAFWVMGFNVLAMFLLGVYFGKRQIFQNLADNRPLFRRLLIWGAGNRDNRKWDLRHHHPIHLPLRVSWTLLLANISLGIAAPMMCLAYLSAFCLLALSPDWGGR